MGDGGGSAVVGQSFRIVAIDGVPTLEAPTADITFGVDGRVAGRATVNRFAGPYTLDGAVLTLGPLAGTLMAGPPAAMEQEQRLHRALARSLTVVPGDGGHVELRDGADVVVLLAASDPDVRM